MPSFVYRAKSGPGKTVEGELHAESRADAVARLDAMGYIPVTVNEKGVVQPRRRLRGRRIGQRDVTLFTRQLASLTRSGVPILRALSTISAQTDNARLAALVEDLENAIRDGSMLSDTLAKYPALFSELYVNMVHSGESAGVLDTILFRLADAREKEEDLRRQVQAATAYPLLIVVVGILTVFALLSFFMPRVIDLFRDYADLPLPTRILIGTSNFFSEYWLWLLLVLVLVAAVFNRLAAMEKGRVFVDRMKLHTPVFGNFVRQSEIARFARTFALLIESGVPVEKGLTLSAGAMRNAVLKDELYALREDTVRQGLPVSAGLKKTRYFPPFVANMAAVGEEAGRLEDSLSEIASFYEKEVDQRTRLATSLLEPVLILIVGAVVGFIVFSMLLPIFKLGTAL